METVYIMMVPCPLIRGYILGFINSNKKIYQDIVGTDALEFDENLFFAESAKTCLAHLKKFDLCSVILLQNWAQSFNEKTHHSERTFINAVGEVMYNPNDLIKKNQGVFITNYLLETLGSQTRHNIKLLCDETKHLETNWITAPQVQKIDLASLLPMANFVNTNTASDASGKTSIPNKTSQSLKQLSGITKEQEMIAAFKKINLFANSNFLS